MDRQGRTICRQLFLLVILAVVVCTPLLSFAQVKPAPLTTQVKADPDAGGGKGEAEKPEKDDPAARLRWQIQHFGTLTPAYRSRILGEAVKHNNRLRRDTSNRSLTRGADAGVQGQSGPAWQNIGPFGADFEQNGSWTGDERDSGRLRTILVHPTDPNIVYVLSSAGGLWKTTNFESTNPTWTPMTDFLPTTAGGAVAFGRDPETLYLGMGDPYDQITVGGAMVKSTDGGKTWSPMIELDKAISVRDVAVDTTGQQDVVLVATDNGLYRSADGGASYAQVSGVAAGKFVWSLAKTSAGWLVSTQEGANCVSGAISCNSQGVIYRSTDQGMVWTPVTPTFTGAGRITLAIGKPDNFVYGLAATQAGNATYDVVKSIDGGLTWAFTATNYGKLPEVGNAYQTTMDILNVQAWYNQMIVVDPTDATGKTVYIGGTYSSAKTTDGGLTWTILSGWLYGYPDDNGNPLPYVHADMHCAAYKTTGTPMVLFGTDGGIFYSSDAGTTWSSEKNNGLATHMFYTITGHPKFPNFTMGGLQDNGTRVRKGNTGIFNQSNGGDGFGVAMSQTDNLEASFQSVYTLKIRRDRTHLPPMTYTQMETSLTAAPGAGFFTPIYAPPATADPSGKVFFAYGYSPANIFVTPDGGMSWYYVATSGSTPNVPKLPAGVSLRDDPFDFAVSPTNINRMVAGANSGRVIVSSDGGATWTVRGALGIVPGWPGFVSNVALADDNTIWVTSVSQAEGLQAGVRTVRVIKSNDFGATWVDASVGLPDVPVTRVYVDPRDKNTVYAATHVGVYRTTDGGASWSPYGTGLPNVRVQDIYMPPDGSYIRVATYGRGIWEIPQLEFVSATLSADGKSCDNNNVLGNDETGHLTVALHNQGGALSGVVATVTSDNPHLTFPSGNAMNIGTIASNSTGTGSIAVALAGATGIESANLTISFNDPALGLATPVTFVQTVRFNYDEKPASSATATFEALSHGWTVSGTTTSLPDYFGWERKETTPLNHSFAVGDSNGNADASLISPTIHFGANPVTMTLTHRYNFENSYCGPNTTTICYWDGGVIEVSGDDGTTWAPVTFAYPQTIEPGDNPLSGSPGFAGRNTSYPAFDADTIDLGTTYADKDVKVRFRAGSDSNTGSFGWEISSVAFSNLPGTPFPSLVQHNEACPTSITLTSTPNPSLLNGTVAFAASITGGVTPITGGVTLKESGSSLGTGTVTGSQAIINLSTLTLGQHNLTATFQGDAGHAASTSDVYVQDVTQPAVTVSATSLSFADTRTTRTSAAQTVTITNVGTAPVVVSSITTNADFPQTSNCTTVAVGANCTISVSFRPTVSGARTGVLTIVSNAPSSPNTVSLSGTGVDPVVGLSRTTVDLGNSLVGVAAASTQTVTLTNSGNVALGVTSIASDTADFTVTNTCGTSVNYATPNTCTITITFKPAASGARSGNIVITDDATDSPQKIKVTGTGKDVLLTNNQATATVKSGDPLDVPMTVTSSMVFAGQVDLACTGMPVNGTCDVVPAHLTVTANSTSNITVAVRTKLVTSGSRRAVGLMFGLGVFGMLLLPASLKRRKLAVAIMIVVAIVAIGAMVGCGGGSGSSGGGGGGGTSKTVAPGTYTLSVTATTNSVTQQISTFTITVQ